MKKNIEIESSIL